MADPEEHPERRKKTIYLLAGGAVSLLLPALGAFYLMNSGGGATAPSGRSDLFERRDAGDKRLTPSQAAVPVAPMAAPSSLPSAGGPTQAVAGSSLDFIKPGADMSSKFGDAPKPATAAATAPAAPPPPVAAPPPPAPAQAKTPAKKGKKEFTMPKLQPTRGFSSMGGKGAAGAKGAAPAGAPAGAQGGGDMSDMLKNLPPDAANNPQLQQYLQQQKGK